MHTKKGIYSIKTLLIIITIFCAVVTGVNAEELVDSDQVVEIKKISKINSRIYKEAILSRSYLRYNVDGGEEILRTIELFFNEIRRDKNIEKLQELKEKTGEALIMFLDKKNLNQKEEKVFNLIKNIYYRSIIELIIYGEIDL